MPVINGPPLVNEIPIDTTVIALVLPSFQPRLVLSDEVHIFDVALVVAIGRFPLILSIWRAIVREAKSMPASVLIILIQQTLICTVEAVASRCKGLQCPEVAHVWCENHHA